jgi:hypothetical protein
MGTMMLALAIGLARQAAPVRAAPSAAPGADVTFELSIYPEKPPRICVNEKFMLYAAIAKSTIKEISGRESEIPNPRPQEPEVSGKVASGVGTLEKVGSSDNELVSLQGENVFVFSSSKPGTATLQFTAPIKPSWVKPGEDVLGPAVTLKKTIKINVGCKLKVKTISQFPVGIYDITVIGDEVLMAADEAGTYAGSGTMYWAYSNIDQTDCSMAISASDSQFDLTGQMDADGEQFTATQTFQPTTVTVTACCPIVGCNTHSGQGSLYPATFSVASSGGVSTQAVEGQGVSGSERIIVVPDEAAVTAIYHGAWALAATMSPWVALGSPDAVLGGLLVTLRQSPLRQ